MKILELIEILEVIEANVGKVKDEDREFLIKLNNDINGTNTLCLDSTIINRLCSIHRYIFASNIIADPVNECEVIKP